MALSLDETIEPLKIVKAKGSKNVIHGIAHVQASFNNTIVSITDQKGGCHRMVQALANVALRARERAPLTPPRWLRRMPADRP